MADAHPAPPPLDVRLEQHTIRAEHPFEAFLALRQWRGARDVYLLESLAGPGADTRSAAVGFGELLQVALHGSSIRLSGVPAVVQHLRGRLAACGLVADGPQLRRPAGCSVWDVQRAVEQSFAVPGLDRSAFGFGALTVYGYDVVQHIEDLTATIPDATPTAEIVMTFYAGTALFDLVAGSAQLTLATHPLWATPAVDQARAALATAPTGPAPTTADLPVPAPTSVTDSITEADFHEQVRTCLRHIGVGDIYQVQIGHQLTVTSSVDELDVYRRLRVRNPSPYMGVLPVGDATMISASPELFLRIEGDRMTMRPIAGTIARGCDPAEDAQRRSQLQSDEKESAEHIMLVDLCRNDLSKVAAVSSVDVDVLKCVEDYSHVFHLVSNVHAVQQDGLDPHDVVRATFPAGTMTGAPKLRAMQIIEGLETSRRGWYAGAFGLVGLGGYTNLGLTIRTLFRSGDTYRTRASAGIVADSTPDGEWRETLAKMSAAHWAVTGEELT